MTAQPRPDAFRSRASWRRGLGVAVAATVALLLTVLAAGPATAVPGQPAPSAGWVRLAHWSPDTPEVDVYLNSVGSTDAQVFPGVGYGVVSPYQRLPQGPYVVSMRLAGAPAESPAVITQQVEVTPGGAFTVAGVGRQVDLQLQVLTDDLTLPESGAKVRTVQASALAPVVNVAAADGQPQLASGATFPAATGYSQVPSGSFQFVATPQDASTAQPASVPASLASGAIYTLVVLDSPGGETIQLQLNEDAAGTSGGTAVPVGGVAAGLGGAADNGADPTPTLALVSAVGFVALAASAALVQRRRAISSVGPRHKRKPVRAARP